MTDRKLSNIRLNKIYTRTGDSGKTHLIGGKKRFKDDLRIESYGTVDELNAQIGLCRELIKGTENRQFSTLMHSLKSIQNELYNLGTQLATDEGVNSYNLPKLSEGAIVKLESEIDAANKSLSELTSFILPGGSVINVQLHIARNVCRRAERRTVALSKLEKLDPENLKYLNRLSDALFVWSRWVSKVLDSEEHLWTPNR